MAARPLVQDIPLSVPPSRAQVLATALLDAVRSASAHTELLKELASLDPEQLVNELNTDAKKKAFWINIYNAMIQIQMADKRNRTTGLVQSLLFFEKKLFSVAGRRLSFNDVEHGILRRSRIWWAFGYLKKIRASDYERRMRADKLDPRIHFALNCAANSCPPIRFYSSDIIDEQLDQATAAYLSATVSWDSQRSILQLPQLLQMFRADFGGRKGEISFVNRYADRLADSTGKYIDPANRPKVRYLKFDRGHKLDYFA